jgi:outer membrane lipoprotein-sorting protein/peroxiredoxin
MAKLTSHALALAALGLAAGPAASIQAQATPAPAKSTIDPQARAIVEQAVAAHQALTSLSATLTLQNSGGPPPVETVTVAFQRPGLAKATVSDKTGVLRQFFADGKALTAFDAHANSYVTQPAPGGGSAGLAFALGQSCAISTQFFAAPENLNGLMSQPGVRIALGPKAAVGDIGTDTVVATLGGARGGVRITFAFGADDHLLRRLSFTPTGPHGGTTHTETVTSLTANPMLTAADFAFTPPAGAKKIVQAAEPPMHDPRLVPGARPFALAAKDLKGRPLSLTQYRGRVVLMDFWATWCGPCVGEMPNVIADYKKYHAQGFDVVGISLDQDRGALTSFIAQNHMPWRQVFDGKGWNSAVPHQYGVMSIPFGLLIGRDGTIQAVEVRGPALGEAIKAALAKKSVAQR